jgi:uncharacterized protein (TIGR01244 family)
MIRFALLLSILLAGGVSFAAHATDFTQPQPGLHTGGQPSQDDLARLKSEGMRTVIDLRGTQEDRGYDEAAEAQRLGLTYIALPIAGKDDVTPANAKTLGELLRAQDGEVLLHCASGNRVGALLAMDAAARGVSREEALALGRKAGLTSLEPVVEQRLPAKP